MAGRGFSGIKGGFEPFPFLNAPDLDRAMDGAGRKAPATIAEFVAAGSRIRDGVVNRDAAVNTLFPGDAGAGARAGSTGVADALGVYRIEAAVEFFVPPADIAQFAAALDAQLRKISASYAAGRESGQFAAAVVRPVPPGAFHQWRVAWRRDEEWLRGGRWSADRLLLDAILRQSEVGWRELLLV